MNKDKVLQPANDEVEIDLGVFLLKLKAKLGVLIISLLIGAFIGGLYGFFMVTPMYSSSSMVYLRTSSASISLQDLQIGTQLTSDYEIIFKSRPVLEKTISDLNLDYSVEALSNMISISNPEDSRILQLSVTAADADLAKNIVNSVTEYGIETVSEIDAQQPYIVEKGITNTQRVSISPKKTTVLGGLIGLVLMIVLLFVEFMLKDTVNSADDVENALGLPVLAIVCEDDALNYGSKKGRKK